MVLNPIVSEERSEILIPNCIGVLRTDVTGVEDLRGL